MISGDNRLQRAERRALQREDEKYIDQPLSLGPDPRSIAAHVRHMVHLFSNPIAASPSADAVAHVSDLFSRTVPKESEKGLACRRGCASCCTQLVTVTAPEAFWVAAQIRRKPGVVAAVRAADQKTHGFSIEERLKSHITCPLLEDAACSIYAARPIGCRMVLFAAMRLRKLKDETYEMNAAVLAALAYEDAEVRWLAGEDIFADVPVTGGVPPNFETAISQLVAHVAPTV
jgi:Fe-S-cluster containining protein